MRIKPFMAVYPNFDYITSVDAFFDTVKVDYPEYRQSGFFHNANKEALYVYEITREGRTHTGLLASVDIEEYINGNIIKHENTIAAKEQQQMHLMISRNAIVKPILLTHPNVEPLDIIMAQQKKPNQLFLETKFEATQEIHKIWQLADPEVISSIQDIFKNKIPQTFIADGHHRCSTTSIVYERMKAKGKGEYYQNLFIAYFPNSQLEVHDYNRVVEGLNESSLTQFMARLSAICNIKLLEEPRKPERKHEMTMFINREWYAIDWRNRVLEKYKDEPVILDANLLDHLVFEDILGIEDIRNDQRIKYVDGPKGIDAVRTRVLRNENRLGFCLYPVALEDIMTIASCNKVMPPKSTWFEPRIKNGIMALEFEPRNK